MSDAAAARERMVREQIEARGVTDELVLAAMRAVPREELVPESERERAYDDGPLPLAEGQTVSQPYVVAAMIALLEPRGVERALEVGAGSGYAAAVLARCVASVIAVERWGAIAAGTAARLRRLGVENVRVRVGDGRLGAPDDAPFDVVLVSAAADEVPRALVDQLALGGRLVMPVGTPSDQHLVLVRRGADGAITRERGEPVRFVPLVPGEAER